MHYQQQNKVARPVWARETHGKFGWFTFSARNGSDDECPFCTEPVGTLPDGTASVLCRKGEHVFITANGETIE